MSKRLKCFLSAPFGYHIAEIQSILLQSNVTVSDLYSITVGKPITRTLKSTLHEADFAVFILSQLSNSTLFEIGFCEALGKPYLIIVGDNEAEIPFYLQNKPIIYAQTKDKDFLRIALRAFIEDIAQEKKSQG